jgi:23S rRNA (cytosine1962-C5)-methyltransferase
MTQSHSEKTSSSRLTSIKTVTLKKGEDRRIRAGHPWIYSNEIDTASTPLKSFIPGEEVLVATQDGTILGVAYINPHSLIAARLFSTNPEDRLDLKFFRSKIKLALQLRERLYDKPYYRLVFSEADGMPGLVVDRFNKDFVIQTNTAGMELRQEDIIKALRSVIPRINSITARNDSSIRELEGLDPYSRAIFREPPERATVEENGASFTFPLLKGQKTGWFYDHRANRLRLKNYVINHSVLDVFSYLGGWGVEAAVFGARRVDCIDSSALACDYIKRNAEYNGVQQKVNVICDDAFDALKVLIKNEKKYNVIIIDPPAFVKRAKDRKEGLLAYQRINELALKLLMPGGILISCSCSMHVSMEDLTNILHRAANKTHHQIQLIERGHQAPDHPVHIAIPETDYLKAIFLRKLS